MAMKGKGMGWKEQVSDTRDCRFVSKSKKTSGTLPSHHPEATAFNAVIPKSEKAFGAVANHQYENVKEEHARNRMATIHITLCINHRGRFERGPCGKVSYVGGKVTEIERVNVDTLNSFFVSDLLKDIGYTSVTNFFWLEPEKELDDGLRDLRVNMDIVRMYGVAVKNSNRINVYTEHPVDEPVLVEENNMTPSKMRVKRCAKRVLTPKKSPKRRLIVVEDEDDTEIVRNMQVGMEDPKRSEAQSREEAYEAHKQAGFEAQKEDNISMAQETANPLLSGSDEAGQSNPSDEVEGRPKVNKRRSTKRPPTGQSFIPNPDPDKPPTFYVPVDEDDFSDENPGHHCYESEELHSIVSDEDTDQTPVFPQSNANAPVSQVRLEVGMEFETLSHFKKAVQKFNINIGRSIFFARCDSTRSKAICYDEDCPWQIYCSKRIFPASYQFMPTPGVVTPTTRGQGTSDTGRGQGRGRGRIRGSSGGKNGVSSGSSNSTPIS
ncbi:hypothetical protein Ahy_B06g084760 [Arachis hypogaea]|uniref:Uncharacterized protein n=1 Tax=Arachis hypogaea TaxID=3818 RepID=A0A444YSR2_ARAHY|nr:hypothetical protein Ahy_B06g084760 [Arachis hypogaea]